MGLVTQQDHIGIAGGLNLYGYANGDPINFSDPFGLCPEDIKDDDDECQAWNNLQVLKAIIVVAKEILAGNENALDVTLNPRDIWAVNSDQIQDFCRSSRTNTGCSGGGLMAVNADRSPEAISQTLVHEMQHINNPGSSRGGEICARRRGQQYVRSMSPGNYSRALSGPLPANVGPLAPNLGCGF
jgi:hypothetical protein